MKKQHSITNFTTTFLQNGTAQLLDDWCVIGTADRSSTRQLSAQQNTIFAPEMTTMIFSGSFVRRSRVDVSSPGFLLTEEIVIVYPGLITGYDAIKIVVRICFALLQNLLTII